MPNSFYVLEQSSFENDYITAAIRFNPDHSIFAGHFPEQPVVPGVCMIQIVKNLVEQALGGRYLFLSHGHQLKFLQLVVPDSADLISVAIDIKTEEGHYPFNASFKKGDVTVFKMTGIFTILHV